MIGRFYKHSFWTLATFVISLFAIAVFPEAGNAHGASDTITIENAATIDADHINEPMNANNHCHTKSGQDCSTQIAFLNTPDSLTIGTGFDVSTPICDSFNKGRSLSFDPPPPRVLS